LTSVDLPVLGQFTKASMDEPFLALILKLEMPVVREILSQDEFLVPEVSFGARGMAVGKTPIELLSACCRLLDLLDAPQDIPFLGGLMQREILYRLLRSPLGRHLRAIATLGEQSNRTAKAVAWLKANYEKPLRVETGLRGADGRLHLPPSFPLADRDEPAAVPEAAAPARSARAHDDGGQGCRQRRLRGRL
jgi:AraC-type transcriptional regulator N-terminus